MRSLVALALACFVCLSTTSILSSDQQLVSDYDDIAPDSKKGLYKVIAKSPLLTLHKALCDVESITGDELEVGDLVVSFLEAHNFTVTTQSVTPVHDKKKRFNIYAVPDPKKFGSQTEASSKASPKVLLSSHIDTVPPHIPYSLSLPKSSKSQKDILISGRGTVDDKACVAAQIQTVLEILADPPSGLSPGDLALLFVVGEETLGDGMKHFSTSKLHKHITKDLNAVLFGEPTELKLVEGHKGIGRLKIDAKGKAAHSGYPWLGKSANSMIIPALMVLDKLGDLLPEEGGLPRSKKFGKSTINVGLIQGGVAANVVPEYAHADITFRLAGGTIDQVKNIILNAVHVADPNDELDLDLDIGYTPVLLDTDVKGFDTITVNYGTDIPNLKLDKNVKRYLYGPGSILVAHGANEGLTVGDMEEAVKGYKKLVKHALNL